MKNVITSKKTKTQNLNLMCNVLFMNRGGSDQVRVHQAFYIQKTKGLNRTEYRPSRPCHKVMILLKPYSVGNPVGNFMIMNRSNSKLNTLQSQY